MATGGSDTEVALNSKSDPSSINLLRSKTAFDNGVHFRYNCLTIHFMHYILLLAFTLLLHNAYAQLGPADSTGAAAELPILQTDSNDTEKAQREARSRVFGFSGQILPLDLPTGKEYTATVVAHLRPMEEFPVYESDVIVIGDVVDQRVFAGANKRVLYTDYTIRAVNVLKGAGVKGDQFSVVRLGGVARTPNGGILRHIVRGYGPPPVVGARYLMFLNFVSDRTADTLGITKLWNIEGDRVVAAFEDDKARVAQGTSKMHHKTVSEVLTSLTSVR